MTKKEFKEALLRGQGRCIEAVKVDSEKYYSIVLWACSHMISFDPQCEGTRAWFMYQLILNYEDKRVFLERIVQSLKKTKSIDSWKILYLAELLEYFSEDGETDAEDALLNKYDDLYQLLFIKKRRTLGLFYDRDAFAMLCEVLADKYMLKISKDIGKLYQLSSIYDAWDFEWLYESKAKKYWKELEMQAKLCEHTSKYLEINRLADLEKARDTDFDKTSSSSRVLSIRLRKAEKSKVIEYAQKYLEQKELSKRVEALEVFSRCPFPLDPLPIINDAQCNKKELCDVAWEVLQNIRHPLVREFALNHIDDNFENALPLVIKNYKTEDEELLIKYVKSIPIDFECTSNWHMIYLDVLNMLYDGLKAPKTLLYFIWEHTYCSCCRAKALKQLGRRRLLTDEMIKESLYDSNDEIRKYAMRIYRRKNI